MSAARIHQFDPDWVVPTADFLRDWMEENGVTSPRILASMCARRDVRDEVAERLRAVLEDDAPLTPDVAGMLAQGTRVPARFWLAFENNYREGLRAGKTVIGDPTGNDDAEVGPTDG